MTRTTLEMWETQEVEVTREGYKWEEKDTTWESVKVEKEGLLCDCCPRTIGPLDDPEPHATLMANPTVHGTEYYDEDVIIDGTRLKRQFKEKFNNKLRSRADHISAYSAHNHDRTITHQGWKGSVSYDDDSPGSGRGIFTRSQDIRKVLQETLDDVMPHAFDGSTKAFKTDAELHFCESCAEAFGLAVTDGIDETVEKRENESSDDSENAAVLIGKDGVDRVIRGAGVLIFTYIFSNVMLGTPFYEAFTFVLESPDSLAEIIFTSGGSGTLLPIILTFSVLAMMTIPIVAAAEVMFGVTMILVGLLRL